MKITKEWLEEYYVRQGLSQRECVELSGTSKGSIYDALKKYGIKAHASGGQRKETTVVNGVEYKSCTDCGELRTLDSFIKTKNGYLTSECKDCRNIKKKQYRQINPDKIYEYRHKIAIPRAFEKLQQFKKEYKEKIDLIKVLKKILSKKRRQEYKPPKYKHSEQQLEKLRENERERYKKNREHILIHRRELYATNPEIQLYNRQKRQRRKTLERQQIATLTRDEWQECLSFFNHSCVYCGSPDNITFEHLQPLSKGGGFTKDNIVPACSHCNFGRKAEDYIIWYKKQLSFNQRRLDRLLLWHHQIGREELAVKSRLVHWK